MSKSNHLLQEFVDFGSANQKMGPFILKKCFMYFL